MERFPDTEFQDFANGVYSIDSPSRAQRESIEEFPPYELAVDEGREMWGTPFGNARPTPTVFRTAKTASVRTIPTGTARR